MRKIFYQYFPVKTTTGLVIIILLLSFSCKTNKPLVGSITETNQYEKTELMTDFSEQSTWLLGYFYSDQLKRPPHSEWYMKGYEGYQYNREIVNKLTGLSTDSLSVMLVLGTWCPDSRREVPRFMRIMDAWNFPSGNITFIGVDDAKLSPVAQYDNLDIQRVPTFIFYKNNIEAGRIIENPVTSLEQDIVNILTKE